MTASMIRSRHAQGGFTIIELLITVVLLAIVVSIGAPSLQELVISTRVKNAASDIYSALIFARSEAIKRSTDVTVTPAAGGWINGWTVAVGATTLRQQDAISNLKIDCPSGTNCTTTLTYRRDGRISTSTIEFFVDETSPPTPRRVAVRCVTVNVSGQVNVLSDKDYDGSCSNG
jgi:type IV fimbrial biogenesis protein FimT